MQLFIRDPSGNTSAYTASSPLELQSQLYDSLSLPSTSSTSSARLSYRSRTLSNNSNASFADYNIVPYSTLDLSFRLLGGGPKKRCAHVSVKAAGSGSSTPTPSSSGVATPSTSAPSAAISQVASEAEGEKSSSEGTDETKKTDEVEASGPMSVIPPVQEPILERCNNAALRMVGECSKCNKNFCGQHRLPEDHACPALQNFRKAAFDENMKRLNKEATFTSKISAF